MERCAVLLLLLLLPRMRQVPAAELEGGLAPAKAIRFLSPEPWSVVRLWGEELSIRVDARDFKEAWLDLGCSLTLLAHGVCAAARRACPARACAARRSRGRGQAVCSERADLSVSRRRGH